MARKIYIAGPMTGIEEKNFPAFYAAAAVLMAMGYVTLNPADNEAGGDLTWEEYMVIDRLDVIASDAIALLPGWENSKGARMEKGWAEEMGKDIYLYQDGVLVQVGGDMDAMYKACMVEEAGMGEAAYALLQDVVHGVAQEVVYL